MKFNARIRNCPGAAAHMNLPSSVPLLLFLLLSFSSSSIPTLALTPAAQNATNNNNNTTNVSAIIGPICMSSTLWSLPTFSATDCREALRILLDGDAATYGSEVFDFLVAGATSRTRYRKALLPVAYQYGEYFVGVGN